MKILIPVDGSVYTQRALDYVASHAEIFGPSHRYVAFTAIAPIPGHASRFLDRDVIDGYYHDEAEKVLAPVREFAGQHGLTLEARHGVGHASEAIAAFARTEEPDLIVMGSHGHSALGNMALGSVATGVIARCAVPVLLVR
jgi:nucleotide-binding universal stress UspA family protein